MVSNIGGIERAWRTNGAATTRLALKVLSEVFAEEVLRYAATMFDGVMAICKLERALDNDTSRLLADMIRSRSQKDWRALAARAKADDPNLRFNQSAARVMIEAWDSAKSKIRTPEQPIRPPVDGKVWCEQCEQRQTRQQAQTCQSRFCPLRPPA